ncbi:unnamed protein product, partial [Mesorhabditis spiculigera]
MDGPSSSTAAGGLPEEIYRQIRAVDQASSTLTRGALLGLSARILDRSEFRAPQTGEVFVVQLVEVIKKPGQSLGLFLREGNGIDRSSGVFVSRLADNSELAKAEDLVRSGDEVLSINNVEVSTMLIDDVVLILSIPRRLLLRIKFNKNRRERGASSRQPADRPVVEMQRSGIGTYGGMNANNDPHSPYGARYPPGSHSQQMTPRQNMPVNGDLPGRSSQRPPGYGIENGARDSFENLLNLDEENRQLRNAADEYSREPLMRAGGMSPTMSRLARQPLATSTYDTRSNSLPRRRAVSGPRNVKWRPDVVADLGEESDGATSAPEFGGYSTRYSNPLRLANGGVGRTVNDLFSGGEHRHWADLRQSQLQNAYPNPQIFPGQNYQNIQLTTPGWSQPADLRGGTRSCSLPSRSLVASSLVGSPQPMRREPNPLDRLILEGRGLKIPDKQRAVTEEMYCVLEVDECHRARTGVSTSEQRYRWKETFHIDVFNATTTHFFIYSWHPQFRHKLCHKGSLKLLEAFVVDQLNGDRIFALSLEPRGQLIVRIVCGSLEKKRMLRDELECSPLGTDLSIDAVPDTNVLACLIKDFLREMPEPLVPLQIHSMLLDAAAVMRPNDVQDTRNLVLSVVDCLPSANKPSYNAGGVIKEQVRPLDVAQACSTLQLLFDMWPSRVSPNHKL